MSRVVFMCGPAGSGKSTVARRLESEGMVRLSFDQEAWNRGLRSMPLADVVRAEIDADLRRHLITLVGEGCDVVLDFSFWSRSMRDEWRALLMRFGVVPETIYLATDRETCLGRVQAREVDHGDDFVLDPELAVAYFDHFQVPTSDEGPLTVIGDGDA